MSNLHEEDFDDDETVDLDDDAVEEDSEFDDPEAFDELEFEEDEDEDEDWVLARRLPAGWALGDLVFDRAERLDLDSDLIA